MSLSIRRELFLCRRAEQFAARSRVAKSEVRLRELLQEIFEDIGFTYFALVHHVDFRLEPEGAIVLHNYPDGWIDYFVRKNMFNSDPIHRACRTTHLGFSWTDVPSMIKFTSDDAEVLRLARLAGIGDGFTIPANVPGEPNGSCSFAVTPDRTIQEDQLPLAQIVGAFAFEAARRLARNRVPAANENLRPLTSRQRECLALVAQGKTDWEISRILGVGRETVIQHLKEAKQRYGVNKRVPLAIKALYDGSITFAEVMEKYPYL